MCTSIAASVSSTLYSAWWSQLDRLKASVSINKKIIQLSWISVEVLPGGASDTSRDRLSKHVRDRRHNFRRIFVALPRLTAGAVWVNGSEAYMDGSNYFANNSAVYYAGKVCKNLGGGGIT